VVDTCNETWHWSMKIDTLFVCGLFLTKSRHPEGICGHD
jgi:hypothetical protein